MVQFLAQIGAAAGTAALVAALAGCTSPAGVPARGVSAPPAASASPAPAAAAVPGLVGLALTPPGPLRLLRGERVALLAVGVDGRGSIVQAPPVERWIARPAGIVEVDATGRVTAVGEGQARVQAQAGTLLSDELPLNVVRVTGVEVAPAQATLAVLDDAEPGAGEVLRLTATVRFSDGGTEGQVSWESSDPGRVRVVDGRVSALAGATPGEVTITARALRDGAAAGRATVTLAAAGQTRVVVQ